MEQGLRMKAFAGEMAITCGCVGSKANPLVFVLVTIDLDDIFR